MVNLLYFRTTVRTLKVRYGKCHHVYTETSERRRGQLPGMLILSGIHKERATGTTSRYVDPFRDTYTGGTWTTSRYVDPSRDTYRGGDGDNFQVF